MIKNSKKASEIKKGDTILMYHEMRVNNVSYSAGGTVHITVEYIINFEIHNITVDSNFIFQVK
jgi:hypothetical protein